MIKCLTTITIDANDPDTSDEDDEGDERMMAAWLHRYQFDCQYELEAILTRATNLRYLGLPNSSSLLPSSTITSTSSPLPPISASPPSPSSSLNPACPTSTSKPLPPSKPSSSTSPPDQSTSPTHSSFFPLAQASALPPYDRTSIPTVKSSETPILTPTFWLKLIPSSVTDLGFEYPLFTGPSLLCHLADKRALPKLKTVVLLKFLETA
ncbi:hypothetical protein JCM11641_001734 [Rhodosporidiobolus odoratus]